MDCMDGSIRHTLSPSPGGIKRGHEDIADFESDSRSPKRRLITHGLTSSALAHQLSQSQSHCIDLAKALASRLMDREDTIEKLQTEGKRLIRDEQIWVEEREQGRQDRDKEKQEWKSAAEKWANERKWLEACKEDIEGEREKWLKDKENLVKDNAKLEEERIAMEPLKQELEKVTTTWENARATWDIERMTLQREMEKLELEMSVKERAIDDLEWENTCLEREKAENHYNLQIARADLREADLDLKQRRHDAYEDGELINELRTEYADLERKYHALLRSSDHPQSKTPSLESRISPLEGKPTILRPPLEDNTSLRNSLISRLAIPKESSPRKDINSPSPSTPTTSAPRLAVQGTTNTGPAAAKNLPTSLKNISAPAQRKYQHANASAPVTNTPRSIQPKFQPIKRANAVTPPQGTFKSVCNPPVRANTANLPPKPAMGTQTDHRGPTSTQQSSRPVVPRRSYDSYIPNSTWSQSTHFASPEHSHPYACSPQATPPYWPS